LLCGCCGCCGSCCAAAAAAVAAKRPRCQHGCAHAHPSPRSRASHARARPPIPTLPRISCARTPTHPHAPAHLMHAHAHNGTCRRRPAWLAPRRSSGCGESGCLLCQYNPSRLCKRNLKNKYLIEDKLKAKCTAPLRVRARGPGATGSVLPQPLVAACPCIGEGVGGGVLQRVERRMVSALGHPHKGTLLKLGVEARSQVPLAVLQYCKHCRTTACSHVPGLPGLIRSGGLCSARPFLLTA